MDFRIEREPLLRALGRLQTIVERRGTLPVLSNVLIRAEPGAVTFSATDLEVSVVGSFEAGVEVPGATTVGAKKLFEIARELDEGSVRIRDEGGGRIRVEAGPARFQLLAISAEEYPSAPETQGIPFAELDAPLVGEMIDRTLYASSTDETRYNLNGVYMERTEGSRIRFVATDGHRLALVEKSSRDGAGFLEVPIIVPRKGVGELRKLCEEAEGAVEIGLGAERFLVARRPGLVLSCRLIDGEFPNYRQVLPGDPRIRLVLPRERLMHAVRRMGLLAHERSHAFRVVLAEGELQLAASNPDLGEAHEAIETDYRGERFQTGLNARYVLDALASISAKEVAIEFGDELAAVRIRPADDPDQLAVIMPMRI